MHQRKLFARSILWAVDAFHENPKEQLRIGKLAQLFFKENPVVVQPVSVVHLGQFNPEEQKFPEQWSELARTAHANLKALFEKAGISNLQSPHLIKQQGSSVSGTVQAFLEYALESDADMILVSSHARKGAARFFMGSFAETLTLHSPLPVLVINPQTQLKKKFNHLIFPTDFSDASRTAFERVLTLARNLSYKVLLIHKMEILHPELAYPFVVPAVDQTSVKELKQRYMELGDSWVRKGKSMGVDVDFYLAAKPGYALEEILKAAKIGGSANIITMATQSGPIKTVLLGSLTRQVLRKATCPVLVIHPHQESLITRALGTLKETAFTYSAHPLMS